MLKANYESNLFRLQDAIAVEYPEKIAKYEELTTAYDTDIKHIDTVLNTPFLMEGDQSVLDVSTSTHF